MLRFTIFLIRLESNKLVMGSVFDQWHLIKHIYLSQVDKILRFAT